MTKHVVSYHPVRQETSTFLAMFIAVLMGLLIATPTALAQDPDVNAATSGHLGFSPIPQSVYVVGFTDPTTGEAITTTVATTSTNPSTGSALFDVNGNLDPTQVNVTVSSATTGYVQTVPLRGLATTEYYVRDVENLYSVDIAFDYRYDVVEVDSILAGSLFDDYTEGVDYIIRRSLNQGAPVSGTDEYTVPPAELTTQPWESYRRSYVTIIVINRNLNLGPIRGNGSLIRINWRARGGMSDESPLIFTKAVLQDEFGNYMPPCFEHNSTDVRCLDPFTVIATGEVDPNTNRPYSDQIVSVLKLGNQNPYGMNFQVALEGNKDAYQANGTSVRVEVTQYGYVILGSIQNEGQTTLQSPRVYIPAPPPYDRVFVSRPGYLSALGEQVTGEMPEVRLLAGDVNNDNAVNIFDLTLMANALGTNVSIAPYLEVMDYNESSRIDIGDLALVAKNFRILGPTPINVR